jgi:catechol-2,3-dioxygenase
MSLITGLGYVGLGVKNVDAWESFGTQILGLENGGRTDDGRQLLRVASAVCWPKYYLLRETLT